jgi:hypothetical protein
VHLLLESLERLADALSDLRQLACTENNEHNGENNDEFRYAHRPEHGLVPLTSG